MCCSDSVEWLNDCYRCCMLFVWMEEEEKENARVAMGIYT